MSKEDLIKQLLRFETDLSEVDSLGDLEFQKGQLKKILDRADKRLPKNDDNELGGSVYGIPGTKIHGSGTGNE